MPVHHAINDLRDINRQRWLPQPTYFPCRRCPIIIKTTVRWFVLCSESLTEYFSLGCRRSGRQCPPFWSNLPWYYVDWPTGYPHFMSLSDLIEPTFCKRHSHRPSWKLCSCTTHCTLSARHGKQPQWGQINSLSDFPVPLLFSRQTIKLPLGLVLYCCLLWTVIPVFQSSVGFYSVLNRWNLFLGRKCALTFLDIVFWPSLRGTDLLIFLHG